MPVASELEAAIEAFLLLADQALTSEELAAALDVPVADVEEALQVLQRTYDESRRGFELRDAGGGWRLWTRADHAELIAEWVKSGQTNRLSQAALETLSVIAYLQPISRGRISGIRGVNVDGVVRTLVARGLVEETSADDSTAALFRTTPYFLERMGLASLEDLPPLAPLLPDAVQVDQELSQEEQ